MTEIVVSIRPRYGEVDSMGVVYHAHYLQYFDVGRTEYMRAAGKTYRDLEDRGFLLAVVAVDVAYRKPARYDDQLELRVRLAELGRASVTFTYELRDGGGATVATASTRLGCLDRSMSPTRLPADVAEALDRSRA